MGVVEMRTLVMLLAVSTAFFSGACAYLLWGADEECAQRSRTLAAPLDSAARDARIDSFVAERNRQRGETDRRLERERAVVDGNESGTQPIAGNPASVTVGDPRAHGLLNRLSSEHRMTMVRLRYGALFHELSLSDAQVEALLPILATYDSVDRPMMDAFASVENLKAGDREREIAAVLGAEKAAAFEELRESMPARMEVRMLRDQLEHAGEPVSEDQQRQLMAALKDIDLSDAPHAPDDESPDAAMERFRAWRTERAKRVREVAAPVLTTRQLQRLDESEALRAALQAAPPPNLAPHGAAP